MTSGPTAEELTQAKNKFLSRSVLRSERPMGRLASLGPPRLHSPAVMLNLLGDEAADWRRWAAEPDTRLHL